MKTPFNTPHAPTPIGPYNQAIRFGNLLFVSGQIPIDPATGELVAGGIEEQTRQVLANLNSILNAAGSSIHHVLKTTVFLSDLKTFPLVNAIYSEFFTKESAPARSTLEVSALPKGALVEIELVASIP